MEREIQIAGHWLVFMLIFGMVLSMLGITGTAFGLAYANPSQAASHPILHPLARTAAIIGPVVLVSGAAILLSSAYGMRRHQATASPAMAPIDYRSLKPATNKAMDEAEAEEEMPVIRSGWRNSY